MLLLQQVDQICRRPHAHEPLHGVEHDIELALGHRSVRGYEWEPLNLTHHPRTAAGCRRRLRTKKHGGDSATVFFIRGSADRAYWGLRMSDLRVSCSAGTTKSDASGSARTMLTSRYTVSPVRGSLCFVRT